MVSKISNHLNIKDTLIGKAKHSDVDGIAKIAESQKVTQVDLATNISGSMGFLLGFSFSSFAETIELLSSSCF